MKVIFLDIDGVLVTTDHGVFNSVPLCNLRRVVQTTGACIVLSTDWRRGFWPRLLARAMLQLHGMDYIGCTPCLSHHPRQRPSEIMQWKAKYEADAQGDAISRWVAIDDRSLLHERDGKFLEGHFVQTDPREVLLVVMCR
mmetsp:Transcript_91914/g.259634  ORF Transcript_91914/g.259634 Transcript_91914/m.259634 type:complete len:140 (+) Transcript_91914:167-586(+)